MDKDKEERGAFPQHRLAKKVLDARAALDENPPGHYDADEEGYVASILNALHQWCIANKVDWHEELFWAQRFFEQDMAESAMGPKGSRIATVAELACPNCNRAGTVGVFLNQQQQGAHDEQPRTP